MKKIFQRTESNDDRIKYIAIRCMLNAMGVELNWTINQEILFSLAFTAKPLRRTNFSSFLWHHCIVGNSSKWFPAKSSQNWLNNPAAGNTWDLRSLKGDSLIVSPASNTDYLNASAFMERFWGYLWPTIAHGGAPPKGNGCRSLWITSCQ